MKVIKTSKKEEIKVDDEDYEFLNQFKWCIDNGYARSSVNSKIVYMHRLLMNNPLGKVCIDHIDRNKLNNQKSNLRVCTYSQNAHNCKDYSNKKTSKYKGVYNKGNSYVSRISFEGKRIYLGSFKTEKEAAKIYNKAAKKYYGEYANLNNL